MKPMRPRTVFTVGIGLGLLLGLAYLVAGPLTLLPGLVVVAWLLRRPPALAGLAGLAGTILGFGTMWLVLVARVLYVCANDPACVVPDARAWLAIGGAILAAGTVLALVARWQIRQG